MTRTPSVLILGANSSIAKATAQLLAQQGYSLFLAARNEDELTKTAQDLTIRYPSIQIQTGIFDATQPSEHDIFFKQVVTTMGSIEGALLCFGYLGNQSIAATAWEESVRIINQNFTGAVTLLNCVAEYFTTNNASLSRFIIGISSVAGDRGRQKNIVYGAAKSALNVYLQGIRHQLGKHKVRVITIKPGYVDTPMTAGVVTSPLMVSPEYVAKRIVATLKQRRHVYYIPWFWRILCGVLCAIPERLFKYMNV